QVEGIKYVAITVEGGQLHDSLGNVVGLMSAEQFIDNAGNEINAYDKVRLRLYFANEDGTALIATNRTMAYNTNISLERLVVEQLLSGPGADVADVVYPVINPNTKIVSVSVRDGICYVNFDENFLNQTYNVSSEVAIYSIVNSLGELTSVNRVQISVNGETDIMYRESISLSTVFERNLELITTAEQ
ncbi:MAG: GerMN domain-containing protein, partial [Lachnospiraceae bacterium]|nr:GerMN domain-containing protein [Lachnospiraceae bacterium]